MRRQVQFDYQFKFFLIGNYNVGKTQLFCRYNGREFGSDTTRRVDFMEKRIYVQKRSIKLKIYKISQATGLLYYRDGQAIFLLFDLNDKHSFDYVRAKWFRELSKLEYNPIYVLVGCKSDLKHDVTKQQINTFLQASHLTHYYQTSAKYGLNINEMFQAISLEVLSRKQNQINNKERVLIKPQAVYSSCW